MKNIGAWDFQSKKNTNWINGGDKMCWFDEWVVVGEEHKIVIIKLALMSPFSYIYTQFSLNLNH